MENMKERLKKIREDLGKTQKEMSKFLGLGEITWQNYERGISKPKLAVMERLAVLGYNIAWVATGDGDMHIPGVRESSTTPNFGKDIAVDKVKIFNLLLNELEKIYSEKNLKNKPHNFLSTHAFELTMNIINLADSNTMALDMIQLVLNDEEKKVKIVKD